MINDKFSTFKGLLEKDKSLSIHSRNLHVLATKVFKSIHQFFPTIMQEKFKLTEKRYNLRRNAIYENRPFCTQKHSIESSVSIALKIWLLVCSHIKKIFMLIFLKNKVKNWLTQNALVNSARDILLIVAIYNI